MPEIKLPANPPRDYQRALWNYLEEGGKRACAIWHRRAGKDEVALNWGCVAAHQRVGTYWHMLPEASQARKAIWEAVNPHTGIRRIDEAFPMALRATTRDNEMFIRFINGSTWQVVGSDNYNSLVGSPPVGVVMSEWAIAHPAAWAYLAPILRENGGWAVFITTPRGKNHAYRTLETARSDPAWFGQVLDAEKTGVFDLDGLAQERKNLSDLYGDDMAEALFRQEYYCSFDAAILGSYWGAQIAQAERDGRICRVDVDPHLPVHTAWDLGVGDSTVIWFWQATGRQIRIVDHYQAHGQGLSHYAAVIKAKAYRPGDDWVPHDAKVREFISDARTRIEAMIQAGLRPRLVPDHTLEDGIQAVRATLPRCVFDAERCSDGIEALKQYQHEWDEKNRTFKDRPLHNWSSHSADAFRYLCMAWQHEAAVQPQQEPRLMSVGRLNNVRMDDLWEKPRNRRSRI